MHSTTVARLLDEMQVERVAHESYSKKSFYGHGRSISLATVMAVVSIIGFMLRGGLAAPKP